jgi:protein-S-isoprenylcysteine O-methyltransferase Ste14
MSRLALIGETLIVLGVVFDVIATRFLVGSNTNSYFVLIYVGGSLVFLGLLLIGAGVMSRRIARSKQPAPKT